MPDKSKNFLGTGFRFPIQVDESTGRVKTSSGEEDIAEAIAFFASEKASFLTGQVLTADGGFIL